MSWYEDAFECEINVGTDVLVSRQNDSTRPFFDYTKYGQPTPFIGNNGFDSFHNIMEIAHTVLIWNEIEDKRWDLSGLCAFMTHQFKVEKT